MHSEGMGIVGMGAVTGYGWGLEAMWEGLVSGKSAAKLVSGYGARGDELAWVAKVPENGHSEDGDTLFTQAMRASAREAVTDAERRGWRPGRRVGLLHAVVFDEVELWRNFYVDPASRSTRDFVTLMPSTRLAMFMREQGFHGPVMRVGAMCASGNAGLITAKAWLDAGIADDVVFVATCLSATREIVLHLNQLGVAVVDEEPLSASRPFQQGSRGFGMGEGSVGFVLSNRSGASYVRMLGGAMTHDAHHATSINPDLAEVRRCFQDALADADVPANAVRYLNAHGAGTQQCDRAESMMAEELFDQRTGIYSVKPLIGHCQGAAGAVEVAVAALGYERGIIPASPTVAPGHPQLMNGVTPIGGGLTVKSSLGLGGHNTAVVLAPPA